MGLFLLSFFFLLVYSFAHSSKSILILLYFEMNILLLQIVIVSRAKIQHKTISVKRFVNFFLILIISLI